MTFTTLLLILLLLQYHMHIQGPVNGSHFLAQPIQLEFTSKQMVTTVHYNWLLLLLLQLNYYYTIICTYRVRQIEATFWRNLFSQILLLNNWLLLFTIIGYYFYYTNTTSTTIALSYAHIGSGKWKPLFGATNLARVYF